MNWLAATLRTHPEVALFLTLALGHLLGRVRVSRLQLNPIIGVLVAGLLIGQIGIEVPAALSWSFFMLFVFAIGYEIGPQFFDGLRQNGARQVAVAVVFALASLATGLALARVFELGTGSAAGVVAGGLTQSAALGTASDAIGRLPLASDARAALSKDVTIAFAVTYLAGLFATIWSLAWLAPRLMRAD